mgnify:CR=1 FL=1
MRKRVILSLFLAIITVVYTTYKEKNIIDNSNSYATTLSTDIYVLQNLFHKIGI